MNSLFKYLCIIFVFSNFAVAQCSDFEIDGTYEASLDLPRIYFLLKHSPDGPAIESASEGMFAPNWAFLDTGASGILLSKETADDMQISVDPIGTFVDTGIGGDEFFDISEPLYVGVLNYDVDEETAQNPDVYHLRPQWRYQVSQNYIEDPLFSEPLDVMGIPVMAGRVAVLKPIQDIDIDWGLDSVSATDDDGGIDFGQIYFTADIKEAGDPNIPATDFQVRLRFEKYINPSNPGNIPPLPVLAYNPVIDNITIQKNGISSTGTYLFDTGGTISVISIEQGMRLGLVDENGDPIVDYDFSVPIGGIGGTVELPGFTLDKLSVPTMNGFNLVYYNARVCVQDIGILDEDTGDFTILDGVFGSNFLCATMDTATWDVVSTPYDYIVVDLQKGILGFDVNSAYPVPQCTYTDLKVDCSVDINDLYILSQNWLRIDCDSTNSFCNASDINKDNKVNFDDYSIFANDWQSKKCQYACGSPSRPKPLADLTNDCIVDFADMQILAEEWLHTCNWLNFNCRFADTTSDGLVNFADFSTMSSQWRK